MAEAQAPIEVRDPEDWEAEIEIVTRPEGRLVDMGQGQYHFTFCYEGTPEPVWPKKKKKKKKKKAAPAPPPPPAPAPKEDWDAEIAASQKEDWDAEIAASR